MNSKSLKGEKSGGKVGVNSALQVAGSNEVEQIENVNPSPNSGTAIQMGDRNINSSKQNDEIFSNQVSKNHSIRNKVEAENYRLGAETDAKEKDTACGGSLNDPSISNIATDLNFSLAPHDNNGHLVPRAEQVTANPDITDVSMKNCENNGGNSTENVESLGKKSGPANTPEQISWPDFVPKRNQTIYVPRFTEKPSPSRCMTFTRENSGNIQIVHMHNKPKAPSKIYKINIHGEKTVVLESAPENSTTAKLAARPNKPDKKKRPPPPKKSVNTGYFQLQKGWGPLNLVKQKVSVAQKEIDDKPCVLPKIRVIPRQRITPWEGRDHRSFIRYVKKFGKNFNQIAMRLGDKSVKQVSEFFQRYNQLYDLDKLSSECEAKSAATQLS